MTRTKPFPRRRGLALIYVTVAFTVLVGFVSFATDYARLRVIKAELSDAVDAATRAACSGLNVSPAQARALAKATALENRVDNQPLALLDADIELGSWNAVTRQFTPLPAASEALADAVRITGQLRKSRGTDVKLTFLPILGGAKSSEMSVTSVSSHTSGLQDVVLVQDVSGSFYNEIALARAGDKDVLDSLNVAGGSSSLGIVAFTGQAQTIAPLKNVAANYASLTTAVNTLSVGGAGMPSVLSGTDIAAGIEKALSIFGLYGQASPNRSMIIVSDGAPTASSSGAHPGYTAAQLLTLAQQDADAAWAQKIHVYVVFWDSANDPVEAANIKTLIRGQGTFVQVTDPTKLSEAIGKIVTKIQMVK
jgi:hypothetical protein